MRLTTADIDRYGPLQGCRPALDDDITIVAGPNESGKTLYLEGVLQLLDESVEAQMDPGPRVTQSPIGRVAVESASERHTLGDGTGLSDISPIEPNHLHNLFVVRDSDLSLPNRTEYYTSLVEHLGNIHTTEIEAIRKKMRDRGKLTKKNLNLRNRSYDTKEVKRNAESLVGNIEDYLETVDAQEIPELERDRLTVRSDLRSVENELDTQRTAREIDAIEDAAEHLTTYSTTTEQVQTAAVNTETLSHLRDQIQERSQAEDRVEELESELEQKREELSDKREDLTDVRERHTELVQRESDVKRVEEALRTYRDQAVGVEDTGFRARLTQRRWVTVAGLVGAGLAGGTGAFAGSFVPVLLGIVLLLVAAAAWLSHRRLTTRAAEADERERDLLQTARDAELNVEAPKDVGPLVKEYQNKLDAVDNRKRELELAVENGEEQVQEKQESLREATEERRKYEDDVKSTLDDAGVETFDEYKQRVEEIKKLDRHRSEAEAILNRELGNPDSDQPKKKIEYWESRLAKRRSELEDSDIDAEQYEEAEIDRLQGRQTELRGRLDTITDKLGDHRDKLDEFERRTNDISELPFVDSEPSMQSRTVDGLRELADSLRKFVTDIERNAEISRKSVRILDTIKEEEEQKVTRLFDPDGPASEVFAQLTDRRYTAVNYDSDVESLEVQTPNGGTFTPKELSRGTRDQLYFATRISLAQQLLSGDSGFLLLDDPFIAADQTRLQNGFETLRELTDDGWQIVYFTAKQEVQHRMADEFGCPVYELELLDNL